MISIITAFESSYHFSFSSVTESISHTKQILFEDVVEEFASTESVKENFERWKFTYGDTYREAYIGLCMPKLLNPFIRTNLILWNPLDVRLQVFIIDDTVLVHWVKNLYVIYLFLVSFIGILFDRRGIGG